MLGGQGAPLDKTREFSEIELLLIERIYNVCSESSGGTVGECV